MRRRQILGVGTVGVVAGMLGSVPVSTEPVAAPRGQDVWEFVACPGCGLPVAFLPSQKANRCAHCKTRIRRGLV